MLFKNKWYILSLLALMIAEPSLNSVLNFWMQRLFNAAVPGARRIMLMRLLTQGFLFWMAKRLISFSSGTVKARFICNAKRDVKHSLFTNLLKMDVSSLLDYSGSGDYISVFTNDINMLEQRFLNQIVSAMSSVFSIVILGSSFLALNRKLAVPILLFGILTMFMPVLFSKRLNRQNIVYSNTISKFTQRLKDYILAYPTIKNYSAGDRILERFDAINANTEDAKFDAEHELNLANNAGQIMAWFMQFLCVGLGLMLVAEGEILIGTVIAARGFANDLGSPLQMLLISINNIRSVKQLVRKLQSLTGGAIEQADKKEERAAAVPEPVSVPGSCDIRFDNVSFSVGGMQVIDHFSFTFREGKKYLVVGKNGSGKSSLFKVLKRWYHQLDGQIMIGECDIEQLDSKTLNRIVSYLNEKVDLFNGSVLENITLFMQAPDEQLGSAVKGAQVELRLDRQIEDEGRNISSGEKRRIEIARSLISSSKVIVLDEVVSTLDVITAYEIEKLVLGLRDKTIIFVSHNFSGKLLKLYDEILVMDGGKLVDHGTYDDLVARSAYFNEICCIKFGDIVPPLRAQKGNDA